MKKVTRSGQPVLVPRSIVNIKVYEEDGKTVRSDFNLEDWNDINIGLVRKMKHYRKKGVYAHSNAQMRELVIEQSLRGLSDDRLCRVAVLALQALVPDRSRFCFVYRQFYGEDYDPSKTKITTLDQLLQLGNQELVSRWFDGVNLLIWSWLRPVFEIIRRSSRKQNEFGWGYDYELPPVLRILTEQLKEKVRQLPIYQTDFKGTIIDGEIYHEPPPAHLPPMVREAQWKGGFHVDPGQIWVSQIKDQGGSFGPICLFYLEYVLKDFPLPRSLEK